MRLELNLKFTVHSVCRAVHRHEHWNDASGVGEKTECTTVTLWKVLSNASARFVDSTTICAIPLYSHSLPIFSIFLVANNVWTASMGAETRRPEEKKNVRRINHFLHAVIETFSQKSFSWFGQEKWKNTVQCVSKQISRKKIVSHRRRRRGGFGSTFSDPWLHLNGILKLILQTMEKIFTNSSTHVFYP